jgi:hypothetical protein
MAIFNSYVSLPEGNLTIAPVNLRNIAGCGRDFAGLGLLAPASRKLIKLVSMQKLLRLC